MKKIQAFSIVLFLIILTACSSSEKIAYNPETAVLLQNITVFQAESGSMSQPQDVLIKEDSKSSITAIIGGILLDVKTGKELNNFSIIVEGNRIKDAGPSDQVTIPPSAKVLKIDGKWILPGLVDMHCHIGVEENSMLLDLYLANGITTIRDAGGNITELRLLRNTIDSQEKIGPRIRDHWIAPGTKI